MKRVLLVSNIPLKNPVRGTPIRIYNLLRQIKKRHKIYVSTKNVEDKFSKCFTPYPQTDNRLEKLRFFTKLIKEKEIDTVLVATENSIKLPLLLKLFTGVNIAIDLHGIRAEEIFFQNDVSYFKKWLMDITTKFYLLFYDLVFVVSEKLKSYYGAFNNNIVVAYGGVSQGNRLNSLESEESDIFTVGYTGNTRSYQGIDYLLEALADIRMKKDFEFNLKLVLSGEEGSIIEQINKRGLDDITTLHFNIPHDEVYKTISPVDVFVIPRPSLKMTEFAFPSKTTEYLLTGVPVIMTKVGPVDELFEGRNVTITINPDNITENLESALNQVYNMDAEEREGLGQRAVNFVKRNLTWEEVGKIVNDELEKI